jgi:hypothetical protein
MKVKRMGITKVLRRIWLFSKNRIKNSESISKQPTQLIVELNSSLLHIIVTNATSSNVREIPPLHKLISQFFFLLFLQNDVNQ